ncbi:MBL fold metallo-hydrolase [Ferrimicrobium sp.]|uniref:MBL fold metallo-hydrolase n=1 Tax=Ferrimicrobium sp. TaxID=2926050 RepID=UPI002639E387|nr:MBL fold metallo-hydrolase [Ferrimicrobium sp.]
MIHAYDTQTLEVGDGIFAYIQRDGSWYLNNAGIIPDHKLSYFIDSTATVARTQALLGEARRLGVGDRTGMVATHHHGDHTNGNATIDPSFLVSHTTVPEEMSNGFAVPPPGLFTPVDWGDIELRLPDLTFSSEIVLQMGGHRVELRHLGHPAHTLGDCVVYFPDDRVLFAGDLAFNGGTPFALMGSVQGWLCSLEALRSFDVQTVIPGHGEPCGIDVFRDIERYLRFVEQVARQAIEAGVEPLEAAKSVDLGEFAGWHDPERIVGNLYRAMAELTGTPPGGPVDVVAAFGAMISYHGGPLACFA